MQGALHAAPAVAPNLFHFVLPSAFATSHADIGVFFVVKGCMSGFLGAGRPVIGLQQFVIRRETVIVPLILVSNYLVHKSFALGRLSNTLGT